MFRGEMGNGKARKEEGKKEEKKLRTNFLENAFG